MVHRARACRRGGWAQARYGGLSGVLARRGRLGGGWARARHGWCHGRGGPDRVG